MTDEGQQYNGCPKVVMLRHNLLASAAAATTPDFNGIVTSRLDGPPCLSPGLTLMYTARVP